MGVFMNVVVLGPAGSGKSLLVGRFGDYLLREHYSVKFLNLDPDAFLSLTSVILMLEIGLLLRGLCATKVWDQTVRC